MRFASFSIEPRNLPFLGLAVLVPGNTLKRAHVEPQIPRVYRQAVPTTRSLVCSKVKRFVAKADARTARLTQCGSAPPLPRFHVHPARLMHTTLHL